MVMSASTMLTPWKHCGMAWAEEGLQQQHACVLQADLEGLGRQERSSCPAHLGWPAAERGAEMHPRQATCPATRS